MLIISILLKCDLQKCYMMDTNVMYVKQRDQKLSRVRQCHDLQTGTKVAEITDMSRVSNIDKPYTLE